MDPEPRAVTSRILRWYGRHRRAMPWRATQDPYRILVSEIMLQQTQVDRVRVRYSAFLRKFPTWQALARAPRGEVIRSWSGLGYNSRAVRLRDIARRVLERFDGELPSSIESLLEFPGIGRYTAHAVACFAFRVPVPVVDTNVRRVLIRMFRRRDERTVWTIARDLTPRSRAADWNLALMDLGALVCTARTPRCGACPVRTLCPSAYRVRSSRVRAKPRGRETALVPRRIYRGRIVEALRSVNHGGWISARSLGPLIKPGFSLNELEWIHELFQVLQRDRLVRIRQSRRRELEVSLA